MNWMQRYKQRVEQENPQRDEVITDEGKRIAIDRGLAPKQQTDNRSNLFLPTETPASEPIAASERMPTEPPQAFREAVSPDRFRGVRTPANEPVPIKDLSRDELIACIRELEAELDEPEVVIDEHWGMVDLQVWLRGLEQQLKKTGRRHPVPMSAEELDYYRVK